MSDVPEIYERDGQLVASDAFLDWLQDGVSAGDLVVVGHTLVLDEEDPDVLASRMEYTGNKPSGRDHGER